MILNFLLPISLGVLGVLQNTLNKKFAQSIGLPAALVVNNFALLICGLGFYAVVRSLPKESLPELLQIKGFGGGHFLLYLLPGLFGFLIIVSAPYSIEKIGATKVFLGIIAGQILISLIWDYYFESTPITFNKAAGAALAMAGTWLATR